MDITTPDADMVASMFPQPQSTKATPPVRVNISPPIPRTPMTFSEAQPFSPTSVVTGSRKMFNTRMTRAASVGLFRSPVYKGPLVKAAKKDSNSLFRRSGLARSQTAGLAELESHRSKMLQVAEAIQEADTAEDPPLTERRFSADQVETWKPTIQSTGSLPMPSTPPHITGILKSKNIEPKAQKAFRSVNWGETEGDEPRLRDDEFPKPHVAWTARPAPIKITMEEDDECMKRRPKTHKPPQRGLGSLLELPMPEHDADNALMRSSSAIQMEGGDFATKALMVKQGSAVLTSDDGGMMEGVAVSRLQRQASKKAETADLILAVAGALLEEEENQLAEIDEEDLDEKDTTSAVSSVDSKEDAVSETEQEETETGGGDKVKELEVEVVGDGECATQTPGAWWSGPIVGAPLMNNVRMSVDIRQDQGPYAAEITRLFDSLGKCMLRCPFGGYKDANKILSLLNEIIEAADEALQMEPGFFTLNSSVYLRLYEVLQTDKNGAGSSDPEVANRVLEETLVACYRLALADSNLLAVLTVMGGTPLVLEFLSPVYSRNIRVEACRLIALICAQSKSSVDLLLACDAISSLQLCFYAYYENRDIAWTGIDCLMRIMECNSISRDSLCALMALTRISTELCVLMELLASDQLFIHKTSRYLHKVMQILVIFAESDSKVKLLCPSDVLQALIFSANFLPPSLLSQLSRIFFFLSQERDVAGILENVGLVPLLVHLLSFTPPVLVDGDRFLNQGGLITPTGICWVDDLKSNSLGALSYLLRLSKPRQEQAALAGLVPKLMEAVSLNKGCLKGHAYHIMCEMAHASCITRMLMWRHGAVRFFVNGLLEEQWQTACLEAICHWLSYADQQTRVESVLLSESTFMRNLHLLFSTVKDASFQQILDPILKLAIKSHRLCKAFGNMPEFVEELVSRLRMNIISKIDGLEGVAGNYLMKILAAICKKSSNPRKLDEMYRISSLARAVMTIKDERVILVEISGQLLGFLAHTRPEQDIKRSMSL
eukprot:Platyproteum_vivax@DN6455_c0_g1_i1.p1